MGDYLTQRDLYGILPFEKKKIQKLIRSGEIPVVKIGRDYLTTKQLIDEWIKENIGQEIYID